MIAIILALAAIGIVQQGPEIIVGGLAAGGVMMGKVLPLMITALVLAGMIQVIISRETVSKWLGKDTGIKGILLAGVAGALIPGGPYVYYPIAASILLSGAGIGTVVTFVMAKKLWSLLRLPMEMALLGVEVTVVRIIVTLVFPFIAGIVANTFFRNYGERVREQIQNIQGAGKKA